MAYVAGTFTASTYGDVIMKEAELLGQGSRMSELKQPIVAGQAILMHQDPTIQETWSGQQCIGAKISNIRTASTLRGNKTLVCEVPAGVRAGTDDLDVTKTILTNPAAFTVYDDQCNNAYSYAERIAYNGLKAKIDLEVELTSVLLALAGSNADAVTATEAGYFESATVTANVDTLEVPSASFGSDIIADILAASQIMDMYDPIVINGRNLFNDAILAQYQGVACCDNDSILNAQNYFQLYWDLKNVDSTLGAGHSLVMDKNSLLFWSSPLYVNDAPSNEVTGDANTYAWREILPRFQYMANGRMNPIYVDVRARRVCAIVNGDPRPGWNYEYVLRGAMQANMTNQDDRTGILKIEKV